MATCSLNQSTEVNMDPNRHNQDNTEETQQHTRVTTHHASSSIYRVKESSEEHELNVLNNRFTDYLDRIKTLANINTELRRQVDNVYQKSAKHIEEEENIIHLYQHSSEIEFNGLRKQMNNQRREYISTQIRSQRAEYDRKVYGNRIKLWLTYDQKDQIQINKQQYEASLHELDLLKTRYEKQKQDLQLYKNQYNEYMQKLIDYTDEYDSINFERIQSENCLYTLKEQLLFEREYNQRCEQEYEYVKQIQYNPFDKAELINIIKKIRQDYETYNEIQIFELEICYKAKFDLIRNRFETENYEEEIKDLIQQNEVLKQESEQLENKLHILTKQNRQQYEISNDEYKQLQIQLSEFESLITYLRDNTVYLGSQINTYRCLLINLGSSSTFSTNDFIVRRENGIIWVRI